MVTIYKKGDKLIYQSRSGLMNQKEILKAEKIYKDLSEGLSDVENKIKKDTEALEKWYLLGKVLKKLIKKFKLERSNEYESFWISIYDHVPESISKHSMPQRSLTLKQNHFYQCMLLTNFSWPTVKSVGNWSMWREIFDNKKIIEDVRILNWLIPKLYKLKKYKLNHKEIRPFLYAISNRLNKIDTSVLTEKELYSKLNEVKFRITPNQKNKN